MRFTRYEIQLSAVSARGNGPLNCHNVQLVAKIDTRHVRAILLKGQESAGLRPQVARTHQSSLNQLGDCRPADLQVEAGVVVEGVFQDGRRVANRNRSYQLITWRGCVVSLLRSARRSKIPPRPSLISRESIDQELPVVLGPSAMLAGSEEYLECYGSANLPPDLSITEGLDSPYPPHSSLLVGESPELREILTRQECWTSPFSALPRINGSLLVRAKTIIPRPRRALVLDTLVALANGPGRVGFEAEFHVEGQTSHIGCGSSPLVFHADPRDLLASICGEVGRPKIGAACDPIVGQHFGYAPPMFSRYRARDLFEMAA